MVGWVGWLRGCERVSSTEAAGRLNVVAGRALVCSSAAVLVHTLVYHAGLHTPGRGLGLSDRGPAVVVVVGLCSGWETNVW